MSSRPSILEAYGKVFVNGVELGTMSGAKQRTVVSGIYSRTPCRIVHSSHTTYYKCRMLQLENCAHNDFVDCHELDIMSGEHLKFTACLRMTICGNHIKGSGDDCTLEGSHITWEGDNCTTEGSFIKVTGSNWTHTEKAGVDTNANVQPIDSTGNFQSIVSTGSVTLKNFSPVCTMTSVDTNSGGVKKKRSGNTNVNVQSIISTGGITVGGDVINELV
jgi:hypothetical protein